MEIKHFTRTEDFTKEDYLEVFRRAEIFAKGGDFTHLARGKIMAVMFFQESTRTVAVFQGAMIRLGGGWLGITNPAGSYVAAGEESVEDTLRGIGSLPDIIAVRHKNFDLTSFATDFNKPLINAMCGGEEHAAAAIWLIFSGSRLLKTQDFKNIKVGFYGMIKSSRPAKGLIKVFSQLGATIYVDSIIPEFMTPSHIQEYSKKLGVKHVIASLEDFIGQVDFLYVTEGLPQAGEDEELVRKYNEKFIRFGEDQLKKVKEKAVVIHGEPSMMTNGQDIVKKEEILHDQRILNPRMMGDALHANMALITYLLNIKV